MARPSALKPRRRGAVAVLAMIFLVVMSTLAVSMYSVSGTGMQSANNLTEVERAHEAAESGLRWIQFRFGNMALPKTPAGTITAAVADGLWPGIRAAVTAEMGGMLLPAERGVTYANGVLSTAAIALDEGRGRFVVTMQQDADPRFIIVRSRGTYGDASRTVSMEFLIDKKIKHSVITRVPLQLGRNTLLDGPLAMTTANKYPPVFALSDFRGITPTLTSRIDAFNTWLKANHEGYDNRVSADDPEEWADAIAAGYRDDNRDGSIDEYDLFVREFDSNGDGAISLAEFTNPVTGNPYDPELFKSIDNLDPPMTAGDTPRSGLNDGVLDNRDGYAKFRGSMHLATSESAWKSQLSSSGNPYIQDQIRGPVASSDGEAGVEFQGTGGDVYGLRPSDFNTTGFKNRTGPAAGTTRRDPVNRVIENAVLAPSDANAASVNEKTPYGSTSFQATYQRPVFRNVTFRNVRIPKGMNALFDNCTFEGVTFVELNPNITRPGSTTVTTTSAGEGMTWAQRMKSGSFSNSTVLTTANSHGYSEGNNLRFNACTFEGPIASDVPTAYTHFANSMEFTGSTLFDNKVDATATVVCPQTNIEMGSFTDPAKAPSTLVGVVVAGNIDIRGSSIIDGSIIVTGDGAGNTTLGWFGPSDAATTPSSPMPEGGWGRITVRYNPTRALPDGINLSVELVPQVESYAENQ